MRAGALPAAPPPLRGILSVLAEVAQGRGTAAYLVGGTIRDLLLGQASSRDVDVTVLGGPGAVSALASALGGRPGWTAGHSHERFGTVRVLAPDGLSVDLAMARTESYPRPGALPVVAPAPSIEADLRRRDFTLHALAAPIGGGGELGLLIDPHGGAADVASRTLRLLHPASLADDPTRALRAAHYAARFRLGPAPGFTAALERSRRDGAWRNVSGDRLRRGLELVLRHPSAAPAIALLAAWGVLDDIVPGWGELAPVVAGATDWAGFVRDAPPALKGAVAERLRFSRRQRQEVAA